MENKVVYLPTFDEALQSAGENITPFVAERLGEMLQCCAVAAGRSFRVQKFTEFKEAESEVERLAQHKGEQVRTIAAAEGRLASMPEGAWILGVVFLAAFAACFGAEFFFNWAILPWMLGVAQRSLLGIALALAPATAPVILDRILARLLGVVDPVDTLINVSGVTRRVRSIVRTAFLIAAAAATLYSIWMLADSRAIASAIMNNDSATGLAPAQQHVLDLSLLLVSLVLTVNGALFYLFGSHEIKRAYAKHRAAREVVLLRELVRQSDVALSKALPVLAAARAVWDQIEEFERSVVERFEADGRVKLAEAMSRPQEPRPATERVRQILDQRLAKQATAA